MVLFDEILENETETEYGEPQYWIYLKSGRSIEITEEHFYSVRLHCSYTEFDDDNFHSTCGVIDQETADSFDHAVSIAEKMIATYKEHTALEYRERIEKMPYDQIFYTTDGNLELCHCTGWQVRDEEKGSWWYEFEDSKGGLHYGR